MDNTQPISGMPMDPHYNLFNQYQEPTKAGLIRELSSRRALIAAMYELKGIIKDPSDDKTDIQITDPIMNERGRFIFFHAVTAAANDINTFSNYRTDVKLIYSLIIKFTSDIIYEFYYNRKEYAIEDESHCGLIINKALGLMLPAFFKALGAGDRSAATRSVSEMIQRAFKSPEMQQRQGGGFFSKLNPLSSGNVSS